MRLTYVFLVLFFVGISASETFACFGARTFTWEGSNSSSWEDGRNFNRGYRPGNNDGVIVRSSQYDYEPVVSRDDRIGVLAIAEDGVVNIQADLTVDELVINGGSNNLIKISAGNSLIINDKLYFRESGGITFEGEGSLFINEVDLSANGSRIFNNLKGTAVISRNVLFSGSNQTVSNNGDMDVGGDIQSSSRWNNDNEINNYGDLLFRNINLSDGKLTINNYSTIDQSGYFYSITNSSAFHNYDGSVWRWSYSGNTYDDDMRRVMDCSDGTNTFIYNATGTQDIIPVDYSNLILAGNNVKYTQNNLRVNQDLTITGSARLNVANANNNISLAGNWINNSRNSNSFEEGSRQVSLNGNRDQYIMAQETFYDLQINKSAGDVYLSDDNLVNHSLMLIKGKLNTRDNYLTIGASGFISGADQDRYIRVTSDGGLKQNNIGKGGRVGDVLFPIGLTSYTPLTINNTSGTADNYTLRMCNGISLNGNCYDDMLSESAINLTWFIDEDVLGGSDANLLFQWGGSEELDGFDRSNISIVHYNGTNWEQLNHVSASGSGPYYASVSNVASFSPFGVASGGPLPVELTYFKGGIQNEYVLLTWQTASELNNDYFSVEKTLDFENYEQVATVAGKGTQSSPSEYSIIDTDPYAGVSYYRLKQTDYDGSVTYSRPVRINNISNSEHHVDLTLFPVPSDGKLLKLALQGDESLGLVDVQIIDVQGRTVYKESNVLPQDEWSIQFNKQLKPGIYSLLINSDKTLTRKFVVK
ncbi:T9SS type A sorting domain-containing protein [Fulvivirga sediminis]|uniref:T9SS type A sorting domain-containing protein n=1 Tax=Fulvivirga sediminis TaxID=2803949 RepID=A0A937FB98_9BACT|nr:T9SS type A sorting domain-containing protein [Fulvivirga sediminis]MBL3657705.1 T9SS type A sorting domain-containing protein [Fulvivirga sediminis]